MNTDTKTCTYCGEAKPRSEFYSVQGKWLSSRCKPCHRQLMGERKRRINAPRAAAVAAQKAAKLASPTKRCSRCGADLPKSEFRLDPSNGTIDGRSTRCKPCDREKGAEWRAKHGYNKAYHQAYFQAHKERYRVQQRGRSRRLRLTALEHYSGSPAHCVCCGEATPEFLTIDHVNGDGAALRREGHPRPGGKLYEWLRQQGYPPGFQTLCWNCNSGRHLANGVCPHYQGQNPRSGV